MKVGNHCCAMNCSNNRGANPKQSFFRFPKEKERCKKWAVNTGRKDLLLRDCEYLSKNLFICSDHFELRMFMNSQKKQLVWDAVPTQFNLPMALTKQRNILKGNTSPLLEKLLKLDTKHDHSYSSISTMTDKETVIPVTHQDFSATETIVQNASKIFEQRSEENEISTYNRFDDDQPDLNYYSSTYFVVMTGVQKDKKAIEDCSSEIEISTGKKTVMPGIQRDFSASKIVVQNAENTIEEFEDWSSDIQIINTCRAKEMQNDIEIRVAKSHVAVQARLDSSEEKLKRKIERLRECLRLSNLEKQKYRREKKLEVKRREKEKATPLGKPAEMNLIIELCGKHLPKETCSFIQDQLRMSDKKVRGKRYSKELKVFALTLYRLSPKAYSFLSKVFALPSKKVIRKFPQRELISGNSNVTIAALKSNVEPLPVADAVTS